MRALKVKIRSLKKPQFKRLKELTAHSYKLGSHGIELVVTDESYTSFATFC